jgi:hypothetical protein
MLSDAERTMKRPRLRAPGPCHAQMAADKPERFG